MKKIRKKHNFIEKVIYNDKKLKNSDKTKKN